MGSCISKCKPQTKTKKKNPYQDCTMMSNHVQDKLIISQAPLVMSPTPPTIRKLALCPSPTPSSSFSFSNSFSCSSKNNSSELTTSTLSSSSSSILFSKDRSFSNEFLRSCAKENPQIIGMDAIKDILHAEQSDPRAKPNAAPAKQSNIPENRPGKSTTQKRARSGSPTLTRQKSFRVEPERTNSACSRNLRSPRSRRFNGENCGQRSPLISTYKYSTKESRGSKSSVNSGRKENVVRPASPSNRLSNRDQSFLRNGERFGRQIMSKMDELGIKEEVLMDMTMENIDNPLIALDCFIFL